MEMYAAVLGAVAALLSPVLFYLWLQRLERQLETPVKPAARTVASDRRSELKEARRALRLLIEKRHPG